MNIHKLLNEMILQEANDKKKEEDKKFEELLQSLPEDQREQVRKQKAEADARSAMLGNLTDLGVGKAEAAKEQEYTGPTIGGESKERASIGRAMAVGKAMIDAEQTGKLPPGILPNQVNSLLLTPEVQKQLLQHQADVMSKAREAGATPEEMEVAAGPTSTSQTLSKMGTAAYDVAMAAAAAGGARGTQVKDMITTGEPAPAPGSVISRRLVSPKPPIGMPPTILPTSQVTATGTPLTVGKTPVTGIATSRTAYKPISIKSKLLALSLGGIMSASGLPPTATAPQVRAQTTTTAPVSTAPKTTTIPLSTAPRTTTPVTPVTPVTPRTTTTPVSTSSFFPGFSTPTPTAPKIPTTPVTPKTTTAPVAPKTTTASVTPKTTTATTEISPTYAKNIISTETPAKAKETTQDVIKTISKIASVAPTIASVASVIPTAASVATSIYNALSSGKNTGGAGGKGGGLPPIKPSAESDDQPEEKRKITQPSYESPQPVYIKVSGNLLKPKGESQQQGSVDRADLAGYYSDLQFGARGTPRDPRISGGRL